MIKFFKIAFLIGVIWAVDSTYSEDTAVFNANDGCARCILKGDIFEIATLNLRKLIYDKTAEALAGSCVATATAAYSGTSLVHNFATPTTSVEALIGACPFQMNICKTIDSSWNNVTANVVTLSEVGNNAKLILDGGTAGANIFK